MASRGFTLLKLRLEILGLITVLFGTNSMHSSNTGNFTRMFLCIVPSNSGFLDVIGHASGESKLAKGARPGAIRKRNAGRSSDMVSNTGTDRENFMSVDTRVTAAKMIRKNTDKTRPESAATTIVQ